VAGHSHGFSLNTAADNTGSAGNHAHNWGGHWSNDNASDWSTALDNGDGNGNTLSDGHFWWGGSGATGNGGNAWAGRSTTTDGNHAHTFTRGQGDQNWGNGGGNSWWGARNVTETTSTAGNHAHTINMHAHRHWLKARATTTTGAHAHSIPALAVAGTVGSGSSGDATFNSGNPTTNPTIAIDPPTTNVSSGTITSSAVNTTNPFQVVNYIIKATNASAPSIVAVNIPTGTLGQTLHNNGSGWQATSNLFNGGTSVGIGSTAPVGALSIGTGNPFQVSSTGAIAAATGITSSGTVTLSGLNTNGLVRTTSTNGILSIGQAGTADIANLAITNAKVNDVAWSKITGAPAFITGNQTITLSGDVTGSGTTSIATTLANSGVGAGTYRSVTVDVKGRVTAGTNPTTIAGYGITDAVPISGSGSYIQNQYAGAQTANLWVSAEVRSGNWFRNSIAGTGLFNETTGAGIYSPSAGLMSTYNGSNFRIEGNTLFTNVGSSTTHGAITVQGEKNGWSGINFKLANGSNAKTLMMHPTHSGVFNTADNNWDWHWTNGTLTVGTVPVSRLAVDAAGGYMHLGAWYGPWNTGNGVLVQGAAYWWGLNPSDRNLKKNINPIEQAELESLTDDLLKTKLYRYEYIEDPMGKGLNHVGMLADEAPGQMRINGEGGINIIEGFMMSVAALKTLNEENTNLKARMAKLEQTIEHMQNGK